MKIKKIKQTIVFTDHIFRNTRLRLSNTSPSAVRLYKQYILRNISDNLNIEPFINPIKSIKAIIAIFSMILYSSYKLMLYYITCIIVNLKNCNESKKKRH